MLVDAEGRKRYRVWFPVVSVFDISQCDPQEGTEPIDLSAHLPVRLTGEDTLGIRDRVEEFLTGLGWTFTAEQIPGETNGFTTLDGSRRVVVDADLEPAMQAKTALHEAAHVLLHVGGTVCEQYSDKYLLHWGERTGVPAAEAIRATAERVQRAIKALMAALDGEDDDNEEEAA